MALDPILAAPTSTTRLELELEFGDDKLTGTTVSRWGVIWDTDLATTVANVNALVDAIEAIVPANSLRSASLVQVQNTVGGNPIGAVAAEAARSERLLVGLKMASPYRDEALRIVTLLRSNGNGTLVNQGVVNSTHQDLVALKEFFDPAGTTPTVRPIIKGTIVTPTGFKGFRYTDR